MECTQLQELIDLVRASKALSSDREELLGIIARHFPEGVDDRDIAAEFKPGCEWNKVNSGLRVAVARLRKDLRVFFKDGTGKKSEHELRVPQGTPYRLEINENHRNLDAM